MKAMQTVSDQFPGTPLAAGVKRIHGTAGDSWNGPTEGLQNVQGEQKGSITIGTDTSAEPALDRDTRSRRAANRSSTAAADAALEFGRFRVLLRRRQLVADGVPIELGTRAFDLLLVLLQADGSLVTKAELLRRVWPGIVVAEENLKVQISALRKALGDDRDFIHTEFGRGYRFTSAVRSTVGRGDRQRQMRSNAAEHVGTFHTSYWVWQHPCARFPQREQSAAKEQNCGYANKGRVPWTSDCKASMRS
jgi:DNA-binding winged helix-turn-helix (wHTH) protein